MEIKFRAWDLDAADRMYSWEEIKLHFREHVEHHRVVVMQYTGLKDKNGKEIYEGDILRKIDSRKMNGVYTVVWYNNGFTIEYKFMRKYDGEEYEDKNHVPIFPNSYEVIGNIYEGVKE